MRVLHLDSGREWRGGQQQLLLLLRFLEAGGCAVAAACREGSPLAARLGAAGRGCFPWLAPGEGGLRALRRLDRAVGEFRPDILHCHDARSILPALWAGRRRKVKVIAHRRVDFPVGRLAAAIKYRPLEAVVAVSGKIREILAARGIAEARILVVSDGIDLERFAAAAPLPRPGLHVGCAGSLVEHKGHAHLVEAAARLVPLFPGLRFSIAGEGPLRRALEERIAALGLAGRFQLPGFVADMPAYYRSLDLYVQPSNLEGMGSAVIEAMASGLPVVAAASGGIPEVVSGHGRLVPPADPRALAEALAALLASPPERTRLARLSLARCKEFDFRQTNAPLVGLYQRLAAGGEDGSA